MTAHEQALARITELRATSNHWYLNLAETVIRKHGPNCPTARHMTSTGRECQAYRTAIHALTNNDDCTCNPHHTELGGWDPRCPTHDPNHPHQEDTC